MIWFKLSNIIDIFEKQNRRNLRKKNSMFFSYFQTNIYICMIENLIFYFKRKIFYKIRNTIRIKNTIRLIEI